MATGIHHRQQKVTPQPESEYSPSPADDEIISVGSDLKIPRIDSLLGDPLPGYEQKYWQVLADDPTEAGFLLSGNNIKIPKTLHIPTGSAVSYIKVYIYLTSGEKMAVWEKYQDLRPKG